jgi:F0F1-type ATP synthase assembly protein I
MYTHPLYKLGLNFILAGLVTTIISVIAVEVSPLEGALIYSLPSLTFVTIFFLHLSGEGNKTIEKYLWSVVVTMPIFIATCAVIALGLSYNKTISYSVSISLVVWILLYILTKHIIRWLGIQEYFI